MILDTRMQTNPSLYSTVNYVYCMTCKKFIETKDGMGVTGLSHGLCPECYNIYMNDMKGA